MAPKLTISGVTTNPSKVNGIRTKTLMGKCDVAVVCFGDKYKQWNAPGALAKLKQKSVWHVPHKKARRLYQSIDMDTRRVGITSDGCFVVG